MGRDNSFINPVMPGKCADCGEPTEIIQRFIGFFGLQEYYCIFCRNCLPAEHRDEHDNLVAAVKAARADYQAKVK